MSTSLWIVLVVVVAWTSFLIGYGVSALTAQRQPASHVSAPAGGYGAARPGAKAPVGGYGETRPAPRVPAGGYGAPAGDSSGSRKRPGSGQSSPD